MIEINLEKIVDENLRKLLSKGLKGYHHYGAVTRTSGLSKTQTATDYLVMFRVTAKKGEEFDNYHISALIGKKEPYKIGRVVSEKR